MFLYLCLSVFEYKDVSSDPFRNQKIANYLNLGLIENHELPNMDAWYVLNIKPRSPRWLANKTTYSGSLGAPEIPTLLFIVSERSHSNLSFYLKQCSYSVHCSYDIWFVFGIWLFFCNIICCMSISFFFN